MSLLVAGLTGFALWPNLRGSGSLVTSTTIHGVPCDIQQRRVSRSNNVIVTVKMPCDKRLEFTLRRERSFDQFAEALHLVRKVETQDDRFDDTIYIGSDETGVDEWLARDTEARKTLLDLLATEPQENTCITSIAASRGIFTLSALTKPPMFRSAPDELGLSVATACAPNLKSCLDRLQAFVASDADPDAFRDPYAVAVRTLTSLTFGLLIVPVVLILLLQLQAPRVELETNLFTDRLVVAVTASVVGALAVVGVLLLRGSARLHTVLGPLMFFGALGAVFAAPPFIRELNAEWDTSAPQRYEAQVLSRYVTHGKHSTYYHVWLSDWHSEADHRAIRVDAATYDALKRGQAVIVLEREGYLGRHWISELSRN